MIKKVVIFTLIVVEISTSSVVRAAYRERRGRAVTPEVGRQFSSGTSLQLNRNPILISPEEADLIREGAEQRSRAMVAFLKDLFSAEPKWKQVIPESLVSYLLRRLNYSKDRILPDYHALLNGVDLIRDGRGQFKVLEDNLAAVSGIGLLEYMSNLLPSTSRRFEANRISPVAQFVSDLGTDLGKENPVVVQIQYDVSMVAAADCYACEYDNWQMKTADDLAASGVYVVTLNPLHAVDNFLNANIGLRLFDDGISFTRNDGTRHVLTRDKDDRFWLTIKPKSGAKVRKPVDVIWPQVRIEDILEWAPGIYRAAGDKKVLVTFSPGADLFDNKVLQSYVPRLIELYLNEKPLLEAPETFVFFDGEGKASEEVLNTVFSRLETVFIKKTEGQGGAGVYSGRSLLENPEEISRLRRKIKDHPMNYVAQTAIPGSSLELPDGESLRIDFRPYAAAWTGPEGLIKSTAFSHIMSRGVTVDREKHNHSEGTGGAFVNAVVVAPGDCRALLIEDGYEN